MLICDPSDTLVKAIRQLVSEETVVAVKKLPTNVNYQPSRWCKLAAGTVTDVNVSSALTFRHLLG